MFTISRLVKNIPELFIIVSVFVVNVSINHAGNFYLSIISATVLNVKTLANQFLLGSTYEPFKIEVHFGTANFNNKFTLEDATLHVKIKLKVLWCLLSKVKLFAVNLNN